jgi:ribokinase
VTLGDMVLDVLVSGEAFTSSRDARGAVRIAPGGSAANFAARAASLGARVVFFGRVGDDVAGRLLVAELERAGVVARVRVAPGAGTGHVLVIVGAEETGSSHMISDPGASADLAPDDLNAGELAAADLVHVSGYSWLRDGPREAARAAVRHARSGHALVSLDPGPAHLIAQYGRERLAADLADIRPDLLFPNLEEGIAMTGEDDPSAIVRALRPLARVVALKLGADGCLLGWDDRVVPVMAAPARVVDTTGAGDAFAAGFAVAYARARDPLAAAAAGARCAAEVIGRVGAR